MSFRGKLLQLQHDVVARWVAVLNGGMGARLAGRTAVAAAGLTGWSDGLIHVLVRRGASTPPKLDGVKVHWTRGEVAVHPGAQTPRVRTAPASVQASSWMRPDRAAMGVLAAGVQQRLVRVHDLEVAVAEAVDVRRRRLVRLRLADIAGGAKALSEIDASRSAAVQARPSPTGSPFVRTWPTAIPGSGMERVETRQWSDDLLRQNEVVIARSDVLRFPSLLVRSAGTVFIDQVQRALVARGWRPTRMLLSAS